MKRLSAALGRPIDVVFDVGANTGSTSKLLLKQFPDCRVYAFEPHPNTFRELWENVDNPRFTPIQLAMSDTAGDQTLYGYCQSGLSSLVPNARNIQTFARDVESELTVETSTIDAFCLHNDIEHVGILKIDAEGHDFEVLKGATRMLSSRAIDFIYFEFNDFMPKDGSSGGSLNEISAWLSGFGFRFIATYTEVVSALDDMFIVANCLMVNQ